MSHSHNRVYHWYINTENVGNMFFLTNDKLMYELLLVKKRKKNFESAIVSIIPGV